MLNNGRRPAPKGLRFSNGILHPEHMAEPGEDGYRTPTGEDIEQSRRLNPLDKVVRQRGSKLGIARELAVDDGNVEATPPSSSSPGTSTRSKDESSKKDRALDQMRNTAHKFEERLVLNWRQRLEHFTWTFFAITMATGGLASVLYHVPFRFAGIYTLGCILVILNLVLFLISVVCISLRFYFHPHTSRNSILHPTESLFMPAAIVSFGTVLMNISQYAYGHVGDWLNTVLMILFWIDVALAVIASFGVYLLM